MTLDEHYINPRLAAVYDIECGWSEDRQFYLDLAGTEPIDVLDLGCGTGLIANVYAASGHRVVGADPAPAMLDVARDTEYGNAVEWVEGFAQDVHSDHPFDLIIMTGHAFQALLEPDDVSATFRNVHQLLKPHGQFVFETRNPRINWSERWRHERVFETPFGALNLRRHAEEMVNHRVRFETIYTFPDGEFSSQSDLKFWEEDELRKLATAADLRVNACFGDWQKGRFDPDMSEEMIFSLVRA